LNSRSRAEILKQHPHVNDQFFLLVKRCEKWSCSYPWYEGKLEEWKYISTYSYLRHGIEMSQQPHVPKPLSPGKRQGSN